MALNKIECTLKIKPVTLNHTEKSGYRNGKHVRYSTREYKYFQKECERQLFDFKKEFCALAKKYRPTLDCFRVSYVYSTPFLRVKSGRSKGKISKKSLDLSNIEKPLEDQLFTYLEVFNDQIDDCMVCEVYKKKTYGLDFSIEITIEVIELNAHLKRQEFLPV